MRSFLILYLVVLCGCARRPVGVNYLVGTECHATAEMRNCDRNSPPNCQKIALTFPKGCEKLNASRNAK